MTKSILSYDTIVLVLSGKYVTLLTVKENNMTNKENTTLSDINGRAVVIGTGDRFNRGDAVRSLSNNKVLRVASVFGGLLRLTNSNGSRPSCVSNRFCKVSEFASKFKFEKASW